jgi:hypothetical protein
MPSEANILSCACGKMVMNADPINIDLAIGREGVARDGSDRT